MLPTVHKKPYFLMVGHHLNSFIVLSIEQAHLSKSNNYLKIWNLYSVTINTVQLTFLC